VKKLKWETKDWIWLLAFLVFAQIFLFINEELIMNVVSYVSTFVSIALAAVAIYISVREATKTDDVKDQINITLGEMREKLSQVDTKLTNIDPKEFNHWKDIKIDEITEHVSKEISEKLTLHKESDPIYKDEFLKIINDNIEKANENLKSSLNFNESSFKHSFIIQEVINELLKIGEFNAIDVNIRLKEKGYKILHEDIVNNLNAVVSFGRAKVVGEGKYGRIYGL
jgi:hypothetical protein